MSLLDRWWKIMIEKLYKVHRKWLFAVAAPGFFSDLSLWHYKEDYYSATNSIAMIRKLLTLTSAASLTINSPWTLNFYLISFLRLYNADIHPYFVRIYRMNPATLNNSLFICMELKYPPWDILPYVYLGLLRVKKSI